jgi:hypothetical protein
MPHSRCWRSIAVLMLVGGLCLAGPGGAELVTWPAHEAASRQAASPLPVRLTEAIPSRPATSGEVFHRATLSLDYHGGPVTLASDAEGTRGWSVDDQMTLRVTHPDGSTSQYQDAPTSEDSPPLDVSPYFQVGVNQVEVELRDVYGDLEGSTELWLSGKAPTAGPSSRLPSALRLPVCMVQGRSIQPTREEVFFTTHFSFYYRGGPVTLAADAAGTRDTMTDDQLTLRITHPDGTTSTYQDAPQAEWLAPLDLRDHFQVGVNQIEVELRDFGDISSTTDLWLSDRAPSPARLPLELFAGVPAESYWPEKEAMATVLGPAEGWEVVLAAGPGGRGGTWATGPVRLTVTHEDGTTKTLTETYRATDKGPATLPPTVVTSLFAPGRNRLEVHLAGGPEGVVASSPLWLALVRRR